jgi:hypothetical protein
MDSHSSLVKLAKISPVGCATCDSKFLPFEWLDLISLYFFQLVLIQSFKFDTDSNVISQSYLNVTVTSASRHVNRHQSSMQSFQLHSVQPRMAALGG